MTRSSKLFLGSFLLVLAALAIFAQYMQYREDNTLLVCVSPPFPVGNCERIFAVPGQRIALNGIAQIPDSGPVVKNYWTQINGKSVPTEVLTDVLANGAGGVDLYATVPLPKDPSRPSPLSSAQQLFQDCINVGGRLYGLDEDGDRYPAKLMNSTGDLNSYPCVVSGFLDPSMYLMLGSSDIIGADENDEDPLVY